jgi:hypothetical protein
MNYEENRQMEYEIKHANLLKDAVDIHLHVAPSLINRYMDIAEIGGPQGSPQYDCEQCDTSQQTYVRE